MSGVISRQTVVTFIRGEISCRESRITDFRRRMASGETSVFELVCRDGPSVMVAELFLINVVNPSLLDWIETESSPDELRATFNRAMQVLFDRLLKIDELVSIDFRSLGYLARDSLMIALVEGIHVFTTALRLLNERISES